MSYLTRSERVQLTIKLLDELNDKPQSLSTLSDRLGKSRDVLWHIFQRLKKAKMIDVAIGINGGIKARPGVTYDEQVIKTVLNYAKPPKFHMVECNVCDEKKKRKLVDRDSISNKHIYIDEQERKWAGRKCPDCVELALNTPAEKLTARKCRDCGDFLPESRYRKCYTCQPVLPDVDDDYLYHAANTQYTGIDDMDEEVFQWGLEPPEAVTSLFGNSGGDDNG